MNQAVIIREALTSEWDEVTALAIAAYHEYAPALTAADWATMRTNLAKVAEVAQSGHLLVAQLDQSLAGAVVYCPPGTSDRRLFQPEWASVRMLAVSPQHRGQGIGAQLSLACVQRAEPDQAEIIALHTSELMVAARRMYERLGFERERELPSRFGLRYWRYQLRLPRNPIDNLPRPD
jgi:ribosomal protein S18 acetylase RimI-like enzyme